MQVLEIVGSSPAGRFVEVTMPGDRIDFHFNKASIDNPAIPPWVIHSRGKTHYIWHLDAEIGFSTRETPEHSSTKGALRFIGQLELSDNDGKPCARIKHMEKP